MTITTYLSQFISEIRHIKKYDSVTKILTIHEELRGFPPVLIHKSSLKKKPTDTELAQYFDEIIKKRSKENQKIFNSYDSLIKRGFTEKSNDGVITLNGIELKYDTTRRSVIFNGVAYDATLKNSVLFYRIAQLYGKLKNET